MSNPPTDTDILDADDVAERLGIAPNTVRKLARNGEIPALRIGKVWRFFWPAVVGAAPGTRPSAYVTPSRRAPGR